MRRLLCLGDSLTFGYGVAAQDRWLTLLSRAGRVQCQNEGLCGDTTAGMLQRLKAMELTAYDAFFLMGGSNDILLDIRREQTQAHMADMITRLQTQGKPVYVGIPPLTLPESAAYGWQAADAVTGHNDRLTAYRQWLLNECKQQRLCVFDFYAALWDAQKANRTPSLYVDGVHPGPAGYALMAQTARTVLIRSHFLTE